MILDFFYDVFLENATPIAVVYKYESVSYGFWNDRIKYWLSKLEGFEIRNGDVVALIGDFTPTTIALLFALIENRNIIVPFDVQQANKIDKKTAIAGVSKTITIA